MGIFSKFGKAYRVYGSEAYRDTMRAVEKVAGATLLLIDSKPEEEQQQILARVSSLVEKLNETVAEETPLVGAVALLMALRVHEQVVQQHADRFKSSGTGH